MALTIPAQLLATVGHYIVFFTCIALWIEIHYTLPYSHWLWYVHQCMGYGSNLVDEVWLFTSDDVKRHLHKTNTHTHEQGALATLRPTAHIILIIFLYTI